MSVTAKKPTGELSIVDAANLADLDSSAGSAPIKFCVSAKPSRAAKSTPEAHAAAKSGNFAPADYVDNISRVVVANIRRK
jgi:hypothetical protein